jgi:hypothetical protein
LFKNRDINQSWNTLWNAACVKFRYWFVISQWKTRRFSLSIHIIKIYRINYGSKIIGASSQSVFCLFNSQELDKNAWARQRYLDIWDVDYVFWLSIFRRDIQKLDRWNEIILEIVSFSLDIFVHSLLLFLKVCNQMGLRDGLNNHFDLLFQLFHCLVDGHGHGHILVQVIEKEEITRCEVWWVG